MGQAIGIDFGTTNTVVSYMDRQGRLKQLRYNGEALIPSVLYFKTRDDYLFGLTAKRMMDNNMGSSNAGVANFKLRVGARSADEVTPDNDRAFKIMPHVAAQYFLNKVIRGVEEKLFREFGVEEGIIDRAVITVPAKFNPTEKERIRIAAMKAMSLAGESVKLVSEPTAAAIAAQYDDGDHADTVLVYDFGGGTFDVSLIQKRNDVFHQITADGDRDLGGNNLTDLLTKEMLERVNEEYGVNFPLDEDEFDEELYGVSRLNYLNNMKKIRKAANTVKEELSEDLTADASFNIYLHDDDNQVFITEFRRSEIEKLFRKDIEHTIDETCRLIERPEAAAVGHIDRVVLAGGSSRIPLIKQLLEERLPNLNISYSDNVSTLISRGAAILAQQIQNIEHVTEQITPVQIGVSATEGMQFNKFQMIIPENLPLPCERSRDFRLAKNGQQSLDIAYYEYDVKNYPEATRIGDDGIQEIDVLHIDLPPGLHKDAVVVTVTFRANSDGSLDVKAVIKDQQGKVIKDGDLHVKKESDLE